MRIAITGTPGCGKTTLTGLLRDQGRTVIDLKVWARECGAVTDTAGNVEIIDVDKLNIDSLPADCFIEGHLAHDLPVAQKWVIRCSPVVLGARLATRGYSHAKIMENLEAEAMDLILQEALATPGATVQRDGTSRTPEDLLASFREVGTDTLKGDDLEPVDWTMQLMDGLTW